MKKISIKVFFLIAFLISSILIFVGCEEKSQILGKWEVFEGEYYNLEFTNEETLYMSNGYSYPYEIKDEKILVDMKIGTRNYGYEIEGNKMVLTDDFQNKTTVYIKAETLKNKRDEMDKLAGKWGENDEVIMTFTEDGKVISGQGEDKVDYIVDSGIIRLDYPKKDPSYMYMEYKLDGNKLTLTNKVNNQKVELVKITEDISNEKIENNAGKEEAAEEKQESEVEYVEIESGSPEYIDFDSITSSSTLKASSNNSYEPSLVTDWKRDTAWVEGKEDDGIGEWIKLEKNSPVKISGIEITNGYTKSEKVYKANNRVKTIKIEFSNGESITKGLNDEFGANNLIEFDNAIETNYIKLTILEVYKGSKYTDTCISEIHAFNTPTIKITKEEYEQYQKEQEETEEAIAQAVENSEKQEKSKYLVETKSGLGLLEYSTMQENGINYIIGRIENPTDKDIEFVSVSFEIYDSEGNQIEETSDSINKLKSGKTWKFKASVLSEEAARFELNDITNW